MHENLMFSCYTLLDFALLYRGKLEIQFYIFFSGMMIMSSDYKGNKNYVYDTVVAF